MHCLNVFRRRDAITFGFLHQLVDVVVVGKVVLSLQSFIEDVQQRIHEVTFNRLWSRDDKKGLEGKNKIQTYIKNPCQKLHPLSQMIFDMKTRIIPKAPKVCPSSLLFLWGPKGLFWPLTPWKVAHSSRIMVTNPDCSAWERGRTDHGSSPLPPPSLPLSCSSSSD